MNFRHSKTNNSYDKNTYHSKQALKSRYLSRTCYELYYKRDLKDVCSLLYKDSDINSFMENVRNSYHGNGLDKESAFKLPSDKNNLDEAIKLMNKLKKEKMERGEKEINDLGYQYNNLFPFWIFVKKDLTLENLEWRGKHVNIQMFNTKFKPGSDIKIIVDDYVENVKKGVHSIDPKFENGFIPLLLKEFLNGKLPKSTSIIYFHKIFVNKYNTICEGYKVHVIFNDPNESTLFVKFMKSDFAKKYNHLCNYNIHVQSYFPVISSLVWYDKNKNEYIEYPIVTYNSKQVWDQIMSINGIRKFSKDNSDELIFYDEYSLVIAPHDTEGAKEVVKALNSSESLSNDEIINLITTYEKCHYYWWFARAFTKEDVEKFENFDLSYLFHSDPDKFTVRLFLLDTKDEYRPVDAKFMVPHYIPMVVDAFIKGYLPQCVQVISFFKTLIEVEENKYSDGYLLQLHVKKEEDLPFCRKFMENDFAQICKIIRPNEANKIDMMMKCVW
ncbi:MAG: hypothetical protein QXW79_01325 [Thermoplasmata archaeon]